MKRSNNKSRKIARKIKRVPVRAKKAVKTLNKSKTHASHNKKMKIKVNKKTVIDKKTEVKEKEEKPRGGRKKDISANVFPPEIVKKAVDELSVNEAVSSYLKKNISKRAIDVLNLLVAPKTDEALALELDMKINAVRRILNLMQGLGITNYYISKNVNGWLSFAWYINVSKLPPFYEYVDSMENKKLTVSNECNDYFVCDDCYNKTKLIWTFDAAFEEHFKCGACGNGLSQIDKNQATQLTEKNNVMGKSRESGVADNAIAAPTGI